MILIESIALNFVVLLGCVGINDNERLGKNYRFAYS